MKKSTLLSLLTAGAVIATSAGTFAAWDQTKGTATSEALSFRAGVTTTVTTGTFTENQAFGVDPSFTATSSISIANIPESVNKEDYSIKVTAYAFDTEDHANSAASSENPGNADGNLNNVDVTVDVPTTPLENVVANSISPKVTATAKNDTENTAGTATTAYILVVAELTPDNSAA